MQARELSQPAIEAWARHQFSIYCSKWQYVGNAYKEVTFQRSGAGQYRVTVDGKPEYDGFEFLLAKNEYDRWPRDKA